MIVNPIFYNVDSENVEQNLLNDLIVESIQIHGMNVVYIPRQLNNFDPLLGTDDQSSYTKTYLIEMYLKSIMGFSGDREFMSKFAGLEIRDQVVWTVSRTRFQADIGDDIGSIRPREGDVIYFPVNERIFQIKHVDQYEMMYPLGQAYTWEITCELFEYSDEHFDTGIHHLDRISELSTNVLDYLITDTDGAPLMTSEGDYFVTDKYKLDEILPLTDNTHVEEEAEEKGYINWGESNPFSEDSSGSHII